MIKVIKRDGTVKEFSFERIGIAIKNCYKDVYGEIGKKESKEIMNVMDNIIDYINSDLENDSISVEEIQIIVVDNLKKVNKVTAKAYEDYMNERTRVRESKSKLVKEIMGLIDNTNIDVLTENSNKQSQLASTQRDLIAGEVSKHIARTSMIPKHLMDAHYQGVIKIHK